MSNAHWFAIREYLFNNLSQTTFNTAAEQKKNGFVEAHFKYIFISYYVFYCGASEAWNLWIASGEIQQLFFYLKCASTLENKITLDFVVWTSFSSFHSLLYIFVFLKWTLFL